MKIIKTTCSIFLFIFLLVELYAVISQKLFLYNIAASIFCIVVCLISTELYLRNKRKKELYKFRKI